MNSLLPKIDEVKLIANKSNATIIGISETKLDNTIMDSELKIEGYDLIRSDRNRHGGGVACVNIGVSVFHMQLMLMTNTQLILYPGVMQTAW